MWTPLFPRVAGVQHTRDGLPLTALDLRLRTDGHDVIVTVSLLYGSPHQQRVEVSTVRLTPDVPRRVEELTAHGVEPVTLAIVAVPAVPSPGARAEPGQGATGRTRARVLRRAGGRGTAALRADIAALSVDASVGMRQVKDAALSDLGAFENLRKAGQSQGFEDWLATTILEYERWLARIAGPVR